MTGFDWSFRVVLGLMVVSLVGAEDISRGQRLLQTYWKGQTEQINSQGLDKIKTREEWEKQRPEYRRQLLSMLGLWPLPPRSDLKSQVTGKVETDWTTVEKIAFQSMPGLYVTGNLYLPKSITKPAPTILYLCGHSPVLVDGISYGNKVAYQHHGAWFAEHGYVCLVIDTLQLGELQGLHHGTHHLDMWWWQSRGYTPAGIECWNAMRALDYLETRPEVDAKKFGVTGRSGGGAGTWYLAAADDRPQSIVPVAGLADLRAHLFDGERGRFINGVIEGHCDCMYFINSYRWDFDRVMALCAPRPLLLGNSDTDDIFPVGGYLRPSAQVRHIYALYGAVDRFDLVETRGGHVDTPELRRAASVWMNRWLRKGEGSSRETPRPLLKPERLKVFDQAPRDAINVRVHEIYRKPDTLKLPDAGDVSNWWGKKSAELRKALQQQVFQGWHPQPGPLQLQAAEDITDTGVRVRAFDYRSEDNVSLRLWIVSAEKATQLERVKVQVLDKQEWVHWTHKLGHVFNGSLQRVESSPSDTAIPKANDRAVANPAEAVVLVAPRGIGPTRWLKSGPEEKAMDAGIRRRFALLGQTLDGQRVWDIRRATQAIRSLTEYQRLPMVLEGKREIGIDALYAFLFEPGIEQLNLLDPPASHDHGPAILNVRTVLDIPQAVALAMSRPVTIRVKNPRERKNWDWPLGLQQLLGQNQLRIQVEEEIRK